jgi:hypothetical protein
MKHNMKPVLALLFLSTVALSCSSGHKDKGETGKADTTLAVTTDTSRKVDQVDSAAVSTNVSTKPNLPSKDWMLVPGLSAGKTRVNENAEEVFKTLGKADGGDAAMQKSVMIWYNNHDTTAHSIAVYTARDTGDAPAARIKQIRVTSGSFKTAEGIHTGSTLSEIKKQYDVTLTETYKDEGKNYKVYSSNKGIAFEMNSDDVCVAIIIYQAGKPMPGTTYLKFRTTNKFFKNS